MHIIRVSVTFLQLKASFSHFKEVFVKKHKIYSKNLKKKKILRKAIIFFGRACFGWVGRHTANQHFLKVGLNKIF